MHQARACPQPSQDLKSSRPQIPEASWTSMCLCSICQEVTGQPTTPAPPAPWPVLFCPVASCRASPWLALSSSICHTRPQAPSQTIVPLAARPPHPSPAILSLMLLFVHYDKQGIWGAPGISSRSSLGPL